MPADCPATPPPASKEYLRFGAIVPLPALPPPITDREDTAEEIARQVAADERQAAVLDEMRALVAARPTCRARGKVRA